RARRHPRRLRVRHHHVLADGAAGVCVPLADRRHEVSRRAFVQQRPAPPFDVQGVLGGHRGRRGGCVMSFPMIDETFYLVLAMKNNGWGLTGRLTARQPSLSRNEICVELKVQVPKALFSRPALKALVSVPKDAPAGSPVITAEVANNVRELLQQQLGMRVEVTVPEEPERGAHAPLSVASPRTMGSRSAEGRSGCRAACTPSAQCCAGTCARRGAGCRIWRKRGAASRATCTTISARTARSRRSTSRRASVSCSSTSSMPPSCGCRARARRDGTSTRSTYWSSR